MELHKAIEMVATDTQESTDPDMSLREAITCARNDLSLLDIQENVDDGTMTEEIAEAYSLVISADQSDINIGINVVS